MCSPTHIRPHVPLSWTHLFPYTFAPPQEIEALCQLQRLHATKDEVELMQQKLETVRDDRSEVLKLCESLFKKAKDLHEELKKRAPESAVRLSHTCQVTNLSDLPSVGKHFGKKKGKKKRERALAAVSGSDGNPSSASSDVNDDDERSETHPPPLPPP